MQRGKTNKKAKMSRMGFSILMVLTLWGCAAASQPKTDRKVCPIKEEAENLVLEICQSPREDAGESREAGGAGKPGEAGESGKPKSLEEFAGICQDLYERASGEGTLAELSTIRELVSRFGEAGYAAVDSKNQIDMTQTSQAVSFCQSAAAGETGEFTFIQVDDGGGFVQYDLQAEQGELHVDRTYFRYEGGSLKEKAAYGYEAEEWQYTPDGYLLFSGEGFSKEKYALMLSGEEEHTALRILPLDENLRELNRDYIQPIGYGRNNLFLVDWSEEDFGELNFYDLFDLFYPMVKGKPVPYEMAENLEEGAVYQIPREEFEGVIQSYFRVDSSTLQSKTAYDSQSGTYTYRPRGFYEAEYPEYPYPEVVECRENEDGTLTLTVQAVFPYKGDARALGHQVVLRLLENGGVQYVSNQVLFPEGNEGFGWHVPRLTEEEWEEVYGKTE